MTKRYTQEFKQTILDLHKNGHSARQLSEDYGVGYSTILKWCQGNTVVSPLGLTADKVKKLQKELKEKDEEIDILKKALGLLAKK